MRRAVVQTVKILFQVLFIMYWFIIGLLIIFKIYTPPRSVIATSFIFTGILMAIIVFSPVPVTKVHIYHH
ncbi:hypothetical protein ACM1TL_14575 [Lysinibacillus capsici]|uniref:hypothetical protein n=1 Tax=Lysinibacillus capsici TaxID=2115968 RepID=UPI0039FD294D